MPSEALQSYAAICDQIESKGGSDRDQALARLLARVCLGISACQICLHNVDAAAEQAREIDKSLLSSADLRILAQKTTLAEILSERVIGGPWQNRLDSLELLRMSSEVIGHPLLWNMWRLHPDSPGSISDEADRAIRLLADSANHPAARIAADVVICCVAAVHLDEQFRDRVAASVAQTLEKASSSPPPDSLAAFEADLLGIAKHTVWRFGDREPLRDRLWLTWRLYQWMIRQFERLPPESRVPRVRELIAEYSAYDLPTVISPLQ